VDWLLVYSLDLQQEPTCELRREAVARLRALRDVRAVTALDRALVATSQTPSDPGRSNECLAADARAAIDSLRGLPPTANPAGTDQASSISASTGSHAPDRPAPSTGEVPQRKSTPPRKPPRARVRHDRELIPGVDCTMSDTLFASPKALPPCPRD
jgi:hypothetical protein